MKKISERLDHAIRESGKSKGGLAAYLGVPQSSVSRWLAGSEPRADRVFAIAKFLGIDAKWLLYGQGEMWSNDVAQYGGERAAGIVWGAEAGAGGEAQADVRSGEANHVGEGAGEKSAGGELATLRGQVAEKDRQIERLLGIIERLSGGRSGGGTDVTDGTDGLVR